MSDAFQLEEAAEALLGEVVDEFLGRLDRGESPEVEEYAARYPQLAAVLRQLLPAVPLLRWSADASRPGAAAPAEGARPEGLQPTYDTGGRIQGPPAPAEGIAPEGPLGDYRIVREVGRGGMGVVYEAVQVSLGRRVALKVLPFAAALDARWLQRFKNEAHAAAQLHYTNIVPVYGVGAERGTHFYAMQFIDGQSLAATIAGLRRLSGPAPAAPRLATTTPYTPGAADTVTRPLAALSTEQSVRGPAFFRAAAHLGVQAARALDHAHALGVIHRDIKPANLLLDGRGNLWVTDFGLAQVQSDTRLTRSGDLVGTLRYMSPEQALAKRVVIDHRTDVYSLGVTLYELLTLAPAFTGRDRQELLRQIAFEEPRPPRRLNPALPAELETVVLKAMAKNPDERYATAGELADDLERFLKDEPIRARRPTLPQRARKWARRHRPVVVSAAAAFLAVLGVAVLALAVGYARVSEEQRQTKEALDREIQAKQEMERALYFQRIASAERELATKNPAQAEELLDECPFHLRGWEWHYLKRRRYQEPLTFREHRGWVFAVAFSPDGKQVASTSAVFNMVGEIKVWDRATGKVLHTLPGGAGPAVGVAFSPDGKRLASAGWDGTVKVWDVARGKLLRALRGHGEFVTCVAFSPDGKLLASGSGDRTVKVWDAVGFQELRTLHGHGRGVYGIAFSPDGKLLASAGGDRTARVWDAATGKELHVLEGHAGPVFAVAFSRDGSRLASAGGDGTVRLWEPAAGRHVLTLHEGGALTASVAFSPDGKRLATGSWEKTVKVWDLVSEQVAITLRGHDDTVKAVAFSPDGQQIVSASMDTTVKVWDAAPLGAPPGPELLTLRGHRGGVISVAWRPDGKALASGGLDATVRLWDAAGGEEVRLLRGHAGPVADVAFSRDGKVLASADIGGVVKVWDAPSGREVRTFRGYSVRVALSPDGRRLASTPEEGTVQVWDTETGKEVVRPFRSHSAPVMCLAFSPDGKRLATGSWDSTARVCDAATGQKQLTLSGHKHVVYGVVFSPDGRRLATASWDGTAKVWDAATGKELLTLRGHDDRVLSVAFSPGGQLLATAGWDSTARIWDAATGKEITILRGPGGLHGVAFSPDGRRLATSGGTRSKGEVTIWDVTRWASKPGPQQP